MDDTYLVEIRLARTRWRIKETTRAIAQKFDVGRYRERHPHITLYGPFTLEDPGAEQHLLDAIGSIAEVYGAIPFTISGWEQREGMHGGVVAFSVHPSPHLRELTAAIARTLIGFTLSLNAWDCRPDEKWFHVTIANLLAPGKSVEIASGLAAQETGRSCCHGADSVSTGFRARLLALAYHAGFLHRHHNISLRPVLLDDTGLRITVMHNDDILGEYDLLRQQWLSQEEIHDPRSWQQTLALYRKSAGFECSVPAGHEPDEIFLISDLHLGHANIIRYCSRPFVYTDVTEMDRVLTANWNFCIAPSDRVYFLGDLRYGRDARQESEYRALLNGKITFVYGNHDEGIPDTVPSAFLECDGIRFCLVHNPADAPEDFDGWIIHGHHHNNDLRTYPFIDGAGKRINVSAEVLGYIPVSLREICRIIRKQVSGSGEPLLLRYPYTR
ncbi:MAG: 2'-5' RNA ligase family protein [Methanoregula sp.]